MAKHKLSITAEHNRIVHFIRTILAQQNIPTAVVAVSGGLDSTLVAQLTSQAISAQHTHLIHLPVQTPDPDWPIVTKYCRTPTDNIHTIQLKPILDQYQSCLALTKTNFDRLRFGNLAARTRMAIVFDLAKKLNALVIGTENKSEHLLGYYTRFGDEASDLEPVRHLYKTQIKQLAVQLKLPQSILDKPPTASLWPGQTDSNELGFTYAEADPILALYHDQQLNQTAIINRGFPANLTRQVINRVVSQAFKHQVPYRLPKILL